MRGRRPKPAEIRQNKTKKVGRATLEAPESPDVPEIQNPNGREWHPLTLRAWTNAWESPMSTQWRGIESDVDALGRLALLWDDFYKGDSKLMAEIRLQESRFGLSPLDRSRLQWEVKRGEDAERQRAPTPQAAKAGADLRKVLRMVSG